ncbi:MAG: ATP-binding protein [Bacteroidia bacterium]
MRDMGQYFPVLSLTGPRQAGKTTLLQQLYPEYRYISFEDPEFRERFSEDPRNFLQQFDYQVIFDEAQRVPELFSYLQGVVDQERIPERYILSGSQNFLLMKSIGQSLAGRVGIARLFPFDMAEIEDADLLMNDPWEVMLNGFYPVHFQTNIPPRFFYPNYIATYLERDIASLVQPSNKALFRRFLQFCASLSGQLINVAGISQSLGISAPTVRSWLSILEQSYIIFLLTPWHNSFGKRITKSPKLYFYDTGLAAYLLELDNVQAIQNSRFRGSLFENLIVAERQKYRYHDGREPQLHFFRDSNGLEVDLVEQTGQKVRLSEIKASKTFKPTMTKSLSTVASLFPDEVQMEVIFGGETSSSIQDTSLVSWKKAGQ